MIAVAHVITGLEVGGAEQALARLVATSHRARFRHVVISLLPLGPVSVALEDARIEVHSLNMRGAIRLPIAVLTLARLLERLQPDVAMAWMYHAMLVGGLAHRFLRTRAPMAWNLRCSAVDLSQYSWTTRAVVHALPRLSRSVPLLVSNTETGRREHAAAGFAPRCWQIIPNGFDTDRFRPDPEARCSLRTRLGIPETARLVGQVGRFDPMKNQVGFLHAAAPLLRADPNLHLLLVGSGVDRVGNKLDAHPTTRAFVGRVHLIGTQNRMERIFPALDLIVQASLFGEGFPNVIGEAMACGVPAVVTDVGDSAEVVGETGWVVPPNDEVRLTAALDHALSESPDAWMERTRHARMRVIERFDLATVVGIYESTFAALAGESDKAVV